MRPSYSEHDLDAELVFDRFLGVEDLDRFQELLAAAAPRWCRRLRVWKGPRDQVSIDVSEPGALSSVVLMAAGQRGETYEALVAEHGRPEWERFVGSAELRGAGPELIIIVSVDETVVAPLGSALTLGNRISIQVRRANVEGEAATAWLQSTLVSLCLELSPAWASAQHADEYWAKVMSDGPTVRAVERDFGRYLPGVFWLNYFGRPYVDLLGARLSSAPGAAAVGDGFLVTVGDDPRSWDEPEVVVAEQVVRDSLGPDLFFSKGEPDRIGVVPDWG